MARIKFTRRPSPALAEQRPLYKITQALLIVEICCRGKKCSLIKLHLLNWALKSRGRISSLEIAAKNKKLSIPVWGFDPALAVALQLALEEEIFTIEGLNLKITKKGNQLLDVIINDETAFPKEKSQLKKIGKGITEEMVTSVSKGWD
ncbi:hypothetical protein N5C55_26330 [Pseudomonas otitidis]|uniref:Uncharacterized protein n=1 Tax=Metapseudomonas otitidis TaxID=319939 RepID=A0A679GCS4_9GAMM|nr:hypothetical protein [Pseudomonas otitidis]MDH1105525.1 hypothetical protein [Pseudomonas otitidis]MDH1161708.1 hypothetical protein [Pseudomonas otitidis]MDH1162569.1 hypothetical protein [Pseudomonas otitidis]BCA28701.1 hypothetical protein PtoMrB4_26780 [Pseudomonas otitidis]